MNLLRLRQQVGEINSAQNNTINQRHPDLKHQGCMSSNKQPECVRILSLNP